MPSRAEWSLNSMTEAIHGAKHASVKGRSEFPDGPRLIADVGAYHVRCALEVAPRQFEHVAEFATRGISSLEEVLRTYLKEIGPIRPVHVGVAISNPIDGDYVRMTNRDWAFSIESLRQSMQFNTLLVVNDFTALAMSLPHIGDGERQQVGQGIAQENAVIGLLGPGAGLGISGLIPANDRWITLGSEGGHASFSPGDSLEIEVLRHAWRRYPHVSAERLVSASGIRLIYEALAQGGADNSPDEDIIIAKGLSGDTHCRAVLDCFCTMLGTIAADVALNLGAMGGIYIGGEIVPQLGEFFIQSGFRQRFEAKGRLSGYLAKIPTYVISAAHPGFIGVSVILSEHLRHADKASLIDHVRLQRETLSRAEQRAADLVLQKPRWVVNAPVGDIALAADVSQPTVIRFCRSLGFKGLSDFKLSLASGLTGTVPIRHSQVSHGDEAYELSAKVLNNTVSAIVRFRDSLQPEAIERASDMLHRARRIEFFGMGNSAVVAQDGQHKFLRFGVPTTAHSDPYVQQMAAGLLGSGDVVVAISGGGQLPEMLRCVDLALSAGAEVIAITSGLSPLARRATVCIPVNHGENSPQFIAMVSRILHLLVIDVLAVGVALQRRGHAELAAADGFDDEAMFARKENASHRISHMR